MIIDKYEHGVPSWVDVSTPDLEKSSAFYAGLFGWECPEGPAEAGGYRVCLLDGKTVAGIGPQMNPDMPVVWTAYVNVDDADAIAAKVTEAGGMVFMPPMEVMDAGRMGIFADTAGAVFGVWQPGQHTGAQVVREPGSLSWTELVTTDVDGAKTFYGQVFGWQFQEQSSDDAMRYVEFNVGGDSCGGIMPKPPMMPAEAPPYWGVYFAVADCDAAVTKATGLGATVTVPAMDIEPGRFAMLADPVGAMFSVIELKDMADS